tara:strand:+ start:848 stop:1063 length:216 start_codon:yes stop_codon:yes gene_type:complete
LIQTLHIATDIKTYNAVQTGAKTQLGGLKIGRTISEYQGSLKDDVIKLPIPDATNVTANIKNKDKYLFFGM